MLSSEKLRRHRAMTLRQHREKRRMAHRPFEYGSSDGLVQSGTGVSLDPMCTDPKRRKTATKSRNARFNTMASTALDLQMSMGNSKRGTAALIPVHRPDRIDGIARALRTSFRNSAPLPRDLGELLDRLGFHPPA